MLLQSVVEIRSQVKALSRENDSATFTCVDALAVAKELALLKNTVASMSAKFAHRAAEGGAGSTTKPLAKRNRRKAKTSNRTPSETAMDIAEATGQDPHKVQGDINTVNQLQDLPAASAALESGQLSLDQASHVGAAASEAPQFEQDLINAAQGGDLNDLIEQANRIRNNARSAEERARRSEQARKNRSFRVYADKEDDTQCKGFMSAPIADMAKINAAIDLRMAKMAKGTEPFQTRAASRYDAFLDLMLNPGEGERSEMRRQVMIMVDIAAFSRGYTVGKERCTIPGVGQVPVSEAWDGLEKAVVRILAKDGEEVVSMASTTGRKITAETKAIAIARDPKCANPRCNHRHGLELEHRRPVSDGGPGVLSNLMMLCPECHYAKTHHGYCLVGPRGSWQWVQRRQKGDGGIGYPLDHDEDPAVYLAAAS